MRWQQCRPSVHARKGQFDWRRGLYFCCYYYHCSAILSVFKHVIPVIHNDVKQIPDPGRSGAPRVCGKRRRDDSPHRPASRTSTFHSPHTSRGRRRAYKKKKHWQIGQAIRGFTRLCGTTTASQGAENLKFSAPREPHRPEIM